MSESIDVTDAVGLVCEVCGEPLRRGGRGPAPRFCSERCTKRNQRGAEDYTAANIKILPESYAWELFDWARVAALAATYNRDAGWIERGLKACQHAGVSPDYFIRRYLEGDKSMPLHEGVDEAFRELFVRKQGRQHE